MSFNSSNSHSGNGDLRALNNVNRYNFRLKAETGHYATTINDVRKAFNSNGMWNFGAYQMESMQSVNTAIAVSGAPCSSGGTTVGP